MKDDNKLKKTLIITTSLSLTLFGVCFSNTASTKKLKPMLYF